VWKGPIRNGVLAKKQEWVTIEDWKDVILGHVDWPEPKKSPGTSTDDWHTLIKEMRLRGFQGGAPEEFVKGMKRAKGV